MGWQDKIAAPGAGPEGTRLQYGALCWRMGDQDVEVLLITSRDTRRWIIPKGWPMPGLAPEASAAQEAWEEAGVEGEVIPLSLGRFGYLKSLSVKETVPCAVVVYGIKVDRLADSFPEVTERSRKWFSMPEAAWLVNEPELARIIASFTPPKVAGRSAPIFGDDEADEDLSDRGPAQRKAH